MKDNPEIPTYTKIGYRVTIIILFSIGLIMLKNCVSSVNYARKTSDSEITTSYNRGFEAGANKAKGIESAEIVSEKDNLLLKKMYQKGYRKGWDSVSTPSTAK